MIAWGFRHFLKVKKQPEKKTLFRITLRNEKSNANIDVGYSLEFKNLRKNTLIIDIFFSKGFFAFVSQLK